VILQGTRFRKSEKLRRAGEVEQLTGYAGTRTRTRGYESNSESNIGGYETTAAMFCPHVVRCQLGARRPDDSVVATNSQEPGFLLWRRYG
jgi:hypothetical protein